MTDYEKLCKELAANDDGGYFKRKTITTLIERVNRETRSLPEKLYIPEYEISKEYFFEILTKLGYNYTWEEEYNSYFEQYCLKVTLSTSS